MKKKKLRDIHSTTADYKKIFEDIILQKFPEKGDLLSKILNDKKDISALDVIELNQILFGNEGDDHIRRNHKYHAYKQTDIFKILKFQKEKNLNNTQLARQFSISRNTIYSWKKKYIV